MSLFRNRWHAAGPRGSGTMLNPFPQHIPGRIGTELQCGPGERPVRSPVPPFNWECKPFALSPCPPAEIPDQEEIWQGSQHAGFMRAYAAGCRLFRKQCGIPDGWIPSSTSPLALHPTAPSTAVIACPPSCAIGIDDESAEGCPPGQVIDFTDPEKPCVPPCPDGKGLTSLKPWGVPHPNLHDICCPTETAQRPRPVPTAKPVRPRAQRRRRRRIGRMARSA